MLLNRIKINGFRNILNAHVAVDGARLIALVGPNGAGKTNFLEALSLLSPGSGLHRAKREEQISEGGTGWDLFSDIFHPSGSRTVGMAYTRGSRRDIRIDSQPSATQTELAALGNVLWFTPRMDRLFLDAAQPRREFLDRLVFGLFPAHAEILSHYRHHLKSRARILKTAPHQTQWLEVEEEQIARLSLQLARNRREFLNVLAPHLSEANLVLAGSFEKMLEESDSPEEDFRARLAENRERDRLQKSTVFGPHRSDFTGILHTEGGDVPLHRASTGQHKRAILHILLANAHLNHQTHGHTPVILLDEVTAHLDEQVRLKLFTEFHRLGTQIWMTGTEAALFSGLQNVCFIEVHNGEFRHPQKKGKKEGPFRARRPQADRDYCI